MLYAVTACAEYSAFLNPCQALADKFRLHSQKSGRLVDDCIFWLSIANYGNFLLPKEWYAAIFLIGFVLAVPAEISLGIWLLLKGANVEQWEKRALESA
jgi:hypothetical protein